MMEQLIEIGRLVMVGDLILIAVCGLGALILILIRGSRHQSRQIHALAIVLLFLTMGSGLTYGGLWLLVAAFFAGS